MNYRRIIIKISLFALLICTVFFVAFWGRINDYITERKFISKYSEKKDFWIVYQTIKENKEFIKKNPSNHSAYDSLGQGYYGLQAYDEAIQAFRIAANIAPEKSAYWSFLGKAYQEKKDYFSARDAYKEVLRLQQDFSYNYTQLSWLFYFRIDSEKDKAYEVLKDGLEHFPDNKELLFDITRYYLYDQNMEEFMAYAPRYLKLDPENALIKKSYDEERKKRKAN